MAESTIGMASICISPCRHADCQAFHMNCRQTTQRNMMKTTGGKLSIKEGSGKTSNCKAPNMGHEDMYVYVMASDTPRSAGCRADTRSIGGHSWISKLGWLACLIKEVTITQKLMPHYGYVDSIHALPSSSPHPRSNAAHEAANEEEAWQKQHEAGLHLSNFLLLHSSQGSPESPLGLQDVALAQLRQPLLGCSHHPRCLLIHWALGWGRTSNPGHRQCLLELAAAGSC